MPPYGGFGGNTGIHDVHNLAWKLALVLRGLAGSQRLATGPSRSWRPAGKFTVEQVAFRALTAAGLCRHSASHWSTAGARQSRRRLSGPRTARGNVKVRDREISPTNNLLPPFVDRAPPAVSVTAVPLHPPLRIALVLGQKKPMEQYRQRRFFILSHYPKAPLDRLRLALHRLRQQDAAVLLGEIYSLPSDSQS